MSYTKLVLITRRFPFFKTESFLESEIGILSKHFKSIEIFPTETSIYVRELPANVCINKSLAVEYQNKRKRILQTVFSKSFWGALYSNRANIHSLKDIKSVFRFVSGQIAFNNSFEKDRSKFDEAIIYTYWFNEATYGAIKFKQKYNCAVSVVSRAHRYDLYEGQPDSPNFWPFRQYCLSHIDRLFVISQDGINFLVKNYKADNNITLSRLGVFDKGSVSESSPKGVLSIVSVSRVEKMKRVDLILSSLVNFASKNSKISISWTHFGDGSLLEELRAKNDQISKPSNLEINFAGRVKNDDIYAFYNENPVDLFINLSSSEGIPVSIMEAQSFGIVSIATDVGGTSEIIAKNNGILLAPNPSEVEVSDAISKIIEMNLDPELVKKEWNELYNANKNFNEFAEELKNIKKK